ncbi:MAG: EamA family transporter [Hyphomicrobiales bacterium]|nr:EamA family transporter [Hyphomicrobiales bacterium]
MAQIVDALPLAPAEAAARYRRGALLVAGAAVAWSTSGLITRATGTDAGTTLFWRSLFATLFLIGYIALRDRRGAIAVLRGLGLPELGIALSFGTSMMCFIIGLKQTSVANVLIFQAASPFVAAVLAWLWLGERVSPKGTLAILATVVGIAVMESDSLAKGRIWGDLFSAIMGLSFAVMIVLARRYRDVSMTSAMCLATVLTGFVTLPFAQLAVPPGDLVLLALFGVGQMGFGLVMFTAGVRLIPAADAGLITVLEVILAPIWVWLAFGEDPGTRAILGGAIVLGAIIVHTLLERHTSGATGAGGGQGWRRKRLR